MFLYNLPHRLHLQLAKSTEHLSEFTAEFKHLKKMLSFKMLLLCEKLKVTVNGH